MASVPQLDERIRCLIDAAPPLTLEEVTSPTYQQVPAPGQRRSPFGKAAVAIAAAAALVGGVVWVTVRHAHHIAPTSVIVPAPTPGRVGQLLAQMRGTDTAPGDNFGWAVSLSGDQAIIGAPGRGGGRAYVFNRTDSGWHQAAELQGADTAANDQFGSSVRITGATAAVGAPGHQGGGRVYMFTDRSGRWRQAQELTGSNTAPNDQFGTALALTNATLVVTAPGRNSNTGEAYVFTHASRGWSQTAELGATGTTGARTDDVAGDAFGSGVDASVDTIVVGAAHHRDGSAYVFSQTTTGWRLVDEISVNPGVSQPWAWSSTFFAISGNTLFVTLTGGQEPVGQTAVLARTPSGWTQLGRLTVTNPSPTNDFYSNSLSLSGTTAVICNNPAAAYVFGSSASGWKLAGTIPGTGKPGFCSSVSASGHQALVGGSGTAYLYHT
jgi:hypothetical protein